MAEPISKDIDSVIVRTTQNYIREAYEAKRDRMRLNRDNYDIFHHKQDYSHKRPGQSQEFLPKQQMAVEQMSNFVTQGLIDMGQWFSVEQQPGAKNQVVSTDDVYFLLQRSLEQAKFMTFVGDSIKTGALASLMIAKVHGRNVPKQEFYTKTEVKDFGQKVTKLFKSEQNVWNLWIELIRPEDFFPDPTGSNLYVCQNMWVDKAQVMALAEGDDAIYDMEAVKKLSSYPFDQYYDERDTRDRETDQSRTYSDYRVRIKLTECWGDIIEPVTGEVLYKNVTWTIANDTVLVSRPKPNPFWHGKNPFVVAPITRVPFSVWHRAPMDGATRHNIAMNELYNLMVDAGMMSVFGIKQIRTDWLEDEREVADGVRPGMTIRASAACPPGAAVIQRVDEGALSPEALQMFNLINSEFAQTAMTNDLRLGSMPSRAVKATEVVEASQSITAMFSGIAKQIEAEFIQPILELSWQTIMQNANDLDSDDVYATLGDRAANTLLALSPEERFAQTSNGLKFKVYGVTQTLNKQKDFRKLTSLLQTIGSSEVLVEAFIKKFSFEKLLTEIVRSLDIEPGRIEQDELDQMLMQLGPQLQEAGGIPMGASPDMQSQIPQASTGPLNPDEVQSGIPRSEFPGSKALMGQ
jgi:hypothetical protein